MRDLLLRGIGVHHGGLLPLVKEVSYFCTLLARLRHSLSLGSRNSLCSRASQGPFCNRDICNGRDHNPYCV
jgi:hypothetical protein